MVDDICNMPSSGLSMAIKYDLMSTKIELGEVKSKIELDKRNTEMRYAGQATDCKISNTDEGAKRPSRKS